MHAIREPQILNAFSRLCLKSGLPIVKPGDFPANLTKATVRKTVVGSKEKVGSSKC